MRLLLVLVRRVDARCREDFIRKEAVWMLVIGLNG